MITPEFLPEEDFKTLIETNWIATEDFPTPAVNVVNDAEDEISRINLDEGDFILVTMSVPEQFTPRGNITYYDRVIPGMKAMCLTKVSCQRVRNMGKMVRAIMFDNMHNFPNYQLIKPMGYKEMVEVDMNIWRAELTFQIEAHAVKIETLQ